MLQKEKEGSLNSLLDREKSEFSPANFLVPGWSGDGIISKNALGLKNNLQILVESASEQLIKVNTNKKLKQTIYQEFLAYAEEHSLHLHELDSAANFWYHLQRENSPHQEALEQFKNLYCFRAVTIYLYKIRFILILSQEMGVKVTETSLMNPNSFFHKLFKKGSSRELQAECLQLNEYSWYRPEQDDKIIINHLKDQLPNISLTEIIKIFSQDSHANREENKLDFQDSEYSHSLSHKSFGLFINKLLIELPLWLEPKNFLQSPETCALKVLNTKFSGEALSSLSLSHCLAQEQNSFMKWEQIISPDFCGDKFHNGNFLKYCHDLHFLTFLVHMAKRQEHNPLDLLCHVMNEKKNKGLQSFDQMSMFMDHENVAGTVYDRNILNLANLPKKNPHHQFCHQVLAQYETTPEDGYVYVLTNQKLFIPSQSEKVENLLKKFQLKASFNLEELVGKGEISNHIFIFQKKPERSNPGFDMNAILMGPAINKVKKETCLNFRLTGQLNQFQNFESFVNELGDMFANKKLAHSPIYQKELNSELSLEFHQDVIVKGKLISSVSNDPGKITHPNFFKNLTKTCLPLSYFFRIESIQNQSTRKNQLANDFLGIPENHQNHFPMILVVDHRSSTHTKLSIASSESYQGLVEKYGHAYYQYFGLTPKVEQINFNLFREFFNSPIGLQIIQLSLGGGAVKTKAKLNALLIPRFFTEASELPEYLENSLKLLGMTCTTLMGMHPQDIESQFAEIHGQVEELIAKYPWQILGRLSHFKTNIHNCLEDFAYNQKDGKLKVDFRNPLIKNPLVSLESFPLLPKHNDVFLKLESESPQDIHLPLERVEFSSHDNEEQGDSLRFFSGDKHIITLYSDRKMLDFVKFITDGAGSLPISALVQNLKLPRLEELQKVIDSYTLLQESLEKIENENQGLITKLFTQQISQQA